MAYLQWVETKMTGNTAPSPLVASSSPILNSNHQAYKVFNGTSVDYLDCWVTTKGTLNGWIQIDLGERKNITSVKITSVLNAMVYKPESSPKAFKILASNDGSQFEEIALFSNVTGWLINETREFNFTNNNKYRYYRVDVTENNGNVDYLVIAELLFGESIPQNALVLKNPTTNEHYSLSDNTLIPLPDSSTKNMILYGIEQGKEIQLDVPFNKHLFHVTTEESTANGRIFTTNIRGKHLIKSIGIEKE